MSDALERISVYSLGRVEYEDGLALQARFGEARRQGRVEDSLLLLEHPPVLTLGRGAKRFNILSDEAALKAQGIQTFDTNRGGDVTYHGPGQLVGYPIFALPKARQDVRRYVRDVEEAVIRTVAKFGIEARRIPKWPGVWLGSEEQGDARKICAIGVHLSRWQTSHGFALNVNTNLKHFENIVACGIQEGTVTSLAKELGHEIPRGDVEAVIAEQYGEIFGARLTVRSERMRTVSVAALRPGPEVLILKRTPERGGFEQLVTGHLEAGESAHDAAVRELREETGFTGDVRALHYEHAFALGESVPPVLVEETAFAIEVDSSAVVALSSEHQSFEWVPVDDALARVPFAGFRAAIRLALQSFASQKNQGER